MISILLVSRKRQRVERSTLELEFRNGLDDICGEPAFAVGYERTFGVGEGDDGGSELDHFEGRVLRDIP